MTRYIRSAATLIESLVVIAIIGVLVAIVLSAVQNARETAARARCANNLKQVALAAHNYHDSYGAMPAGCSYEDGLSPQPNLSWLARLLPFVEQEALWQETVQAFLQEKFFETPPHYPIMGSVIKSFVCPSDPFSQTAFEIGSLKFAFTDYLGVWGTDYRKTDGILFLDSAVRIADITDGTTNTIMIGERPPSADHSLGWWYAGWGQERDGSAETVLGVRELKVPWLFPHCPPGPYEFAPGSATNDCDAFHFWSHHAWGANFAIADGSVRFLTYSSNSVLPALATIAGGEAVELP